MFSIVLLLLNACGGRASNNASLPPQTASAAPPPAATASPSAEPTSSAPDTLKLADSRYGKIIVDSSGRALYLFDADRGPVSTCYADCAKAWPPFIATRAPNAASDLSQSLTSTTTRNDGLKQVTYNGHPLYYYVGDPAPGQVNCQAAVEFGGGWYVVDGQGNKISRG